MKKITVVADSHVPYLQSLSEIADMTVLPPAGIDRRAVAGADALIVRTRTRCDAALLEGSRVIFVGTATIGTDHAPHELKDKQGGCAKAASGMPMVQFSLVSMLQLVDEGVLTIERMVELMAHQPAQLFQVSQRGFLRKGYQADIVIVRPQSPWKVTKEVIQSKCQWSPMEGHEYQWQVEQTFCNGHLIYNKGVFDADYRGEELNFRS